MIAIVVKVQGNQVSHRIVHESTNWYDFEELVKFENFGKDLIIEDMVSIEVPEAGALYALIYIYPEAS